MALGAARLIDSRLQQTSPLTPLTPRTTFARLSALLERRLRLEEHRMRMHRLSLRSTLGLLALAVIGLALATPARLAQAQQLTSPEQFFGFQMGADRKLARWDKLVEYYNLLDRQSDRMQVVNLGPTTMGNPFLVLFVSSPANLARLEELRPMNAKLADPRGVPEDEIRRIVANGKAVVVQSFGLHSSEVAASQTAAELMYDLLRRTDDETQRIMDNVIAIMIPCFNPDGEILVTDWYHKYVGTEYEGVGLNVLYHKYVGHDNNRDAFMTNMVESQYAAKILFRDWIPQAYIDHHQMGPYGARIYVPPYAEPIRPEGDPLVWREMSWWGAHIAYKEEEAGLNGVVNAAIYSGWGHFGFHWITPFHNIAGMLTESASARLATPLYLHPDQVQGGARGLPEYEAQTTFPNPWPRGWWRGRGTGGRWRGEGGGSRNTRRRPRSPPPGPVAGGGCATSWSGRKSPPGPPWILRGGIARRVSGKPISKRKGRPSAGRGGGAA